MIMLAFSFLLEPMVTQTLFTNGFGATVMVRAIGALMRSTPGSVARVCDRSVEGAVVPAVTTASIILSQMADHEEV